MSNTTLQQWLNRLRTRPARKPHRAKLSLQGFEQRDVPSAAPCPAYDHSPCHVTVCHPVAECPPKPSDNAGGGKECSNGSNGKGSGAKGSHGKGSGAKGSNGKGSGAKCDNGSKGKGSNGKGSGAKCDNGSNGKGSNGKGSNGKGNDRCDPPKPPVSEPPKPPVSEPPKPPVSEPPKPPVCEPPKPVCETPKPVKQKGNNGVGNGLDGQPPGNPRINDGPGTSPGNPGNRGGK